MKKYAILSILGFAIVVLLGLGVVSDVEARLNIPEDPSPDACIPVEKRGKACDRWYQEQEQELPPEVIVLRGVKFDVDSSRIRPSSYHVLDENVRQLKNRNQRIRIEGHTDSDGSEAYNQRLSEARAQSVVNYFASKGIRTDRMRSVGRGELQPVATNETPEGKQQNRRIEIHME